MLGAYLLCVAGFALFALSQASHWGALLRRPPPSRRRVVGMRALAWACLAGALVLAIEGEGASFGSLAWVALLAAGAATVTALLTVRASR